MHRRTHICTGCVVFFFVKRLLASIPFYINALALIWYCTLIQTHTLFYYIIIGKTLGNCWMEFKLIKNMHYMDIKCVRCLNEVAERKRARATETERKKWEELKMTIKDVTNKMRHKAIPHNFHIISWWMLPLEESPQRREETRWNRDAASIAKILQDERDFLFFKNMCACSNCTKGHSVRVCSVLYVNINSVIYATWCVAVQLSVHVVCKYESDSLALLFLRFISAVSFTS